MIISQKPVSIKRIRIKPIRKLVLKTITRKEGNQAMTYVTFPTGKSLDFTAIGRLCIDLNANEINRPMEETMTFTKYVGALRLTLRLGCRDSG